MDFAHNLPIYRDVVFPSSVVRNKVPDVLNRGQSLVLIVLGCVKDLVEVVLEALSGVVE